MQNKRILAVGTMYLDINCIHFPFEEGLFAHRETVGDEYLLDLGGSALNFAKIAAALEMNISFLGKTGADETSKTLISLLEKNNITSLVVADEKVQTNIAVHYIHEDGSSIMTSSGSANQSLSIEDLEDKFDSIKSEVDYLYLGGLFKLKNLLPHLQGFLEKARAQGIKVVLDHGRINNNVTLEDIACLYKLFPYIDIYLPSEDEFLSVWKSNTLEEGFSKLSKIATPLIIIKQAENGATGFKNYEVFPTKPYAIKTINTVGAGDSFNAGFIYGYSQDMSFEEAIRFACATAATKISSKEPITQKVVKKMYKRKD